jgi:hypothetical protein
MDEERSTSDIKKKLSDIRNSHTKEEAIKLAREMLAEEYRRIAASMRDARNDYLNMNAEDPGQQNDVADMRLEAVEEYQPAFVIENFLAEMDVDVISLAPKHKGSFEVSSHTNGEWSLSVASLKESVMRTLGGHCNVIGDIIVLEKLLYDHTYLAAVMKLTDDYEPGKESFVEFHFYTVVFDEEIQSIIKMPLNVSS